MEYQDIELVCTCGEKFTWSAGEQTFMNDLATQGKVTTVIPPKRCASCRQKRKMEREMRENANFEKGNQY